jgi:hypothetical protein
MHLAYQLVKPTPIHIPLFFPQRNKILVGGKQFTIKNFQKRNEEHLDPDLASH